MRPASDASVRRGMTLVEVVLALGLFGILAAFVVGIVDSVLQLWQTGERRGRGDLEFAVAMERLRSDLAGLVPGPGGWLVLDTWEASPATETSAAWRLPRLRFLADGSVAPEADPTGRGGVEVCWALVPEGVSGRMARLVRYAQPSTAQRSFREETWMREVFAGEEGLVVLDGVLHGGFRATLPDGSEHDELLVPPDSPLDFPARVELMVERVAGLARSRPPTLDAPVGAEDGSLVLRGSPPPALPEFALIESEWVRLAGGFPRPRAIGRGERGTLPTRHPAGSPVFLPATFRAAAWPPGGGRRSPW